MVGGEWFGYDEVLRSAREMKHGLTVWGDWSHSLKFVLTTSLFEVISANVSIFDPSLDRIDASLTFRLVP